MKLATTSRNLSCGQPERPSPVLLADLRNEFQSPMDTWSDLKCFAPRLFPLRQFW